MAPLLRLMSTLLLLLPLSLLLLLLLLLSLLLLRLKPHDSFAFVSSCEEPVESDRPVLDPVKKGFFRLDFAVFEPPVHVLQEVAFLSCEPWCTHKALDALEGVDHLHRVDCAQGRVGGVVLANTSTNRDTAFGPQAIKSCLKMDTADIIKVHVDSIWSSFLQGLGKALSVWALLVVDCEVKPELFFDQFALFGATAGTDDLTVEDIFREHTYHRPYSASSTAYKDGLAFDRIQNIDQAAVSC
mmetsp:Transcript_26625/g.52461  ORF Transcript_26625/g.52461 Transcript_26625/m.52461 type:complete len:242 (-) Transcript_26625:433-1158(-)